MQSDESLILPRPFRSFASKRVVYVPVDTPAGILSKHISKRAARTRVSEWGTLVKLDDKVVLFQAMGAPLAVMTLERLIASGAEEILVLGFCGSLDPGLAIASAVSVSRAYSDEGTSGRYLPRRKYFRASPTLAAEVEAALAARSLSAPRVQAVSTDAPFRETGTWLGSMIRLGCRIADMETSAVFALAEFRGKRAAALMIVSDELSSGKWKPGFFETGLEESVERHFLPFL